MTKNGLIKKICSISCALVFISQFALPSLNTFAATSGTSSASEDLKTITTSNNNSTNVSDGVTKKFNAVSNQVSYDVAGDPTVGNTIDISVNMSYITNLYGASVDFLYDTSLIEVQSITVGSLFSNVITSPTIQKVANGQANIAMALNPSNTPISASGSIAVIKAKVLKAGTINLQTTDTTDSLSLSGFTTCVKLADNLGGKIGYTFVDNSIATTAITLTSYEDNSSYFKYIGSWSLANSSSFSGNSIRYSNTLNSYLEFKYTGSNLKLIGTKAASRGIAKIDIDNGAVSTEIDAYNSSTLAQQTLYENNSLSNGDHTVRIYVTGKKNTNSSDTIIDIDRIDINGTAVAPTSVINSYEDTSSFIKAMGAWTSATGSSFSNNSILFSGTINSYLEFRFSGSSFKWYGTKAASRGIAKIDIDNANITTEVDAYNSSTVTNQLLYENNSLLNAEHVVRIFVTGKKNTAASNILVDVDRFDVNGTAIAPTGTINPYEDTSSFIKAMGTWTSATGSNFSNNSILFSNVTDAYLEFKFSGSSFKWYGTKAASRGIARIDIDNGAVSTEIDAYNPTTITTQLLYENNSLPNQDHIVRIYVTGKKNTAASNYIVDVDKFGIDGAAIAPTSASTGTLNSYEDTSSSINAVGTWTSATGSSFGNNSILFSNITNDYLEFKFYGSSFKWYGTKAATRGIAKIDIDNGTISTEVDSYSPSTVTKQLLYENNSLSIAEHTIKIYVTGKKNAAASNYIVDVDRLDTDGAAINSYEDTSLFMKPVGTWTTATGSIFNNNSIKFSKTTNDFMEFKFSGSSFKWYGTKAASRGIAKIDIDNGAISTEIDGYSSSTITKQLFYENNSLANAEHTIKIYVTGKKNSAASDTIVDVDKIDILGTVIAPTDVVNSYEDSSSLIKTIGTWTTATGSIFNNNSIKFSKTTNDFIEFKFSGSSFKWYGTKAASRGIAKVDIDNGAISTEIDAYDSSTTTKQVLYQNNSLSNSEHIVRIYVTGKKNPAASDIIVDIDKFDVNGVAY